MICADVNSQVRASLLINHVFKTADRCHSQTIERVCTEPRCTPSRSSGCVQRRDARTRNFIEGFSSWEDRLLAQARRRGAKGET